MAVAKKNYSSFPWEMKRDTVKNDFVLITEFNRKNAMSVLGRIYYNIELAGSKHLFGGASVVSPRLTKGKWLWPHMPWSLVPKDAQNKTHWEVYYDKDEDYNEWKLFYETIIKKGIENKTLYINPKDPILTFFKK